MKKLCILLIAIFIIGCSGQGKLVEYKKGNEIDKHDYCVEFLFEVDGVKIYRFQDSGYSRYFSIGNGSYINSKYTIQTSRNTYTTYSDGVNQ